MAASGKGMNKYSNSRSCFNFGACFGFSSRKKHDQKKKFRYVPGDDDGELVKYGISKSVTKTFPISNAAFVSSESVKEIHVVHSDPDEAPPPPLPHRANNKKEDMFMEKNKQKLEVVQETSKNNFVKLPHQVSLPVGAPRQKKQRPAAAAGEGRNGKETELGPGGFDSIVGAAIIVLTLVVMLIWGKTFAILCAATWLYFIHRLRQNDVWSNNGIEKSQKDSSRIDLDSKEYKKKVVLQGLLERI